MRWTYQPRTGELVRLMRHRGAPHARVRAMALWDAGVYYVLVRAGFRYRRVVSPVSTALTPRTPGRKGRLVQALREARPHPGGR